MNLEKTVANILIIDPSCLDHGGHHFRSVLDLANAVAPMTPSLMLNTATPPDLFPAPFTHHGGLSATVYDESRLGARPDGRLARRIWKLKRAWGHALSVGRSGRIELKYLELPTNLAQLDPAVRIDHIVLPSADVALVSDVLAASAASPNCAGTLVHARLISVEANMAPIVQAKQVYETANPNASLHLYVEMPAMARHLKATTGLDAALYPYLLAPPVATYTKPYVGGPLVFGFLGGARNEKGFNRLPNIIKHVCSHPNYDRTRLAFLIQSSGRTAKAERAIAQCVADIRALDITVTFADGVVDNAAYADLMSQIDVVMLPYVGTRYRLSGSGILNEAIVSAKPVIASAGLSFGDVLGSDHGIEATNDQDFANAIIAMATRPQAFLSSARATADQFATDPANRVLLTRLRMS
jgi:hypothetical protein